MFCRNLGKRRRIGQRSGNRLSDGGNWFAVGFPAVEPCNSIVGRHADVGRVVAGDGVTQQSHGASPYLLPKTCW